MKVQEAGNTAGRTDNQQRQQMNTMKKRIRPDGQIQH